MLINQRSHSIALIGLAVILLGSSAVSLADEGDARLQKRITELEAENRSLRKILAGIQNALKSVPASAIPTTDDPGDLRILVMPGDWGESQLADIRKVCESAGKAIAEQLKNDGFAPIIVQRGKSGPITLYERGVGNEHVMRLDTSNRAWAQLAFQFAHEYCHIVCNYRNASNPQKWFEETLCECASLYALRRMAVEWKTNPPYSNWSSYSESLASYASDRIKTHSEGKESIAQFYQANQAELEKSGTNRALNTYIATKLLRHFEENPAAWQSLRYLNLGLASENTSFKAYLTGWHARVPKEHQSFVRQIGEEFGVQLPSGTSAD